MFIDVNNWNAFFSCVEDLIYTPEVQSMRKYPHHPGVNCYEHSVFVAYAAFRLARRFGWDYRSCARAGLLHDLYLYEWWGGAYKGNMVLDHPEAALRNAKKLTYLTEKEQNIIRAHMWPLALHMPRSREAWTVSLTDKICCALETVQIYRRTKMRSILSA